MIKQKVLKVSFGQSTHDCEKETPSMRDLEKLMEEGWKVVNMQSFSQGVSAYPLTPGYDRAPYSHIFSGDYGMVFVLERQEK